MAKLFTVPPPTPARSVDEVKSRVDLMDIPIFGDLTEEEIDDWIERKADHLFEVSNLDDDQTALDLAVDCARTMYMAGLAYEAVREMKNPALETVRQASNVSSKIGRCLRQLGIVVIHRDAKAAAKFNRRNRDPFGP